MMLYHQRSAGYIRNLLRCLRLLTLAAMQGIHQRRNAASRIRKRDENLPGSAGKLVWGPWRIPEPFGTGVNAFACVYLLIVFFFTFWPPATPVTPDTMNYSSLVMGFVAITSGLY